jgi:hypothetical protein
MRRTPTLLRLIAARPENNDAVVGLLGNSVVHGKKMN